MIEPVFIKITDYQKINWYVNIKRIFEITDEVIKNETITSISYYSTPIAGDSEVTTLKTPESTESILEKISHLKKL